MVLGAKQALQQAPSRGRISLMMLQSLAVQKKRSVVTLVYGGLMVILGIVLVSINPIQIATDWFMQMKEGSFLFRMYQKPSYQLFSEIWVYNYTNVEEFLSGTDKRLRLQEIGPFKFQEIRTNENLTIDHEKGVLHMVPKNALQFLPEESIAHYRDVPLYVPNIALLAISTLLADKFGYLANAGAYYSINALGSKLFRNMTAEELMWGYYDPVVTVANNLLPGWIDFHKIGVLDRFYAEKQETTEVELRNPKTMYSINKWNDLPGLPEQGFTDLNSSIFCNRIKGSFEGMMMSPNITKDTLLPIYRRQACRVYPFVFEEEVQGEYGFPYYKFAMERSAFNSTSKYSCKCDSNCLPEGFIDVSNCYYGFPIALSKPHFLDTDPVQQSYYEGMHPDPEKHSSFINLEPRLGAPLSLSTMIQVNIAVRMNSGNPITRPLKDMVVPIVWISLSCKEPPPEVVNILRLRFVIAPPLLITVEVLLFIVGFILGSHGIHRILKPKYKLIQTKEEPIPPPKRKKSMERRHSMDRRPSMERRLSTVILNMTDNIIGFKDKDDDELAKEAVSLLAITEEDNDMPDLLMLDS